MAVLVVFSGLEINIRRTERIFVAVFVWVSIPDIRSVTSLSVSSRILLYIFSEMSVCLFCFVCLFVVLFFAFCFFAFLFAFLFVFFFLWGVCGGVCRGVCGGCVFLGWGVWGWGVWCVCGWCVCVCLYFDFFLLSTSRGRLMLLFHFMCISLNTANIYFYL